MKRPEAERPVKPPFEPRHPTWLAVALLSVWIVILSLPMLAGRFLASPWNDQLNAGYAYRLWGADQWKALGHVPLWNPEIYGGLPFVAAMHGDIFYPTAWLRLFLPTSFVMNVQFPVHFVLAGLFAYLLLRMFKTSWTGSVVGALAYEMSGVIISYVAPGHDGKLFVTTLLPLVLIGLLLGMRDRRFEGYGLVALGVGLALLSPQSQMTYYLLVASGFFALYLAIGAGEARPMSRRVTELGLALAAVAVGFGISMIQTLPFMHYIPLSPRAEGGGGGFDWSALFAIPWSHVPEFFLSGFVGQSETSTYWGPNPIKLHSEYLGLPVVALAGLGAFAKERRRLIYWLGGIGGLFLLVGMGAATPFYRIWWSVMPFADKVRAPGMALYVVCLVVAMLAAFGVERIERGHSQKASFIWMITGGLVALLGAAGVFTGMAEGFARTVGRVPDLGPARAAITVGALGSGVALLLVGVAVQVFQKGRASPFAFALLLPVLLGADMWRAGRPFWLYSDPPETSLYAPNAITDLLQQQKPPYRVLDSAPGRGAVLMAFGIPQLLGHHGFELRTFNDLLGGQGSWQGAYTPRMWDLFAVQYIVLPSGRDSLPGHHRRLQGVPTVNGPLDLFESDSPRRYGRLVPAAVKWPDSTALGALYHPQFSFDALVVLDQAAPVDPAPVTTMPAPLNVTVSFPEWIPGRMTAQLEPAAPQDGYLVVSENYYPDWHATVDGQQAPVLRGNHTLITVPVRAGAREVRLTFESADYKTGKVITLLSTVLALLVSVVPAVLRRRKSG